MVRLQKTEKFNFERCQYGRESWSSAMGKSGEPNQKVRVKGRGCGHRFPWVKNPGLREVLNHRGLSRDSGSTFRSSASARPPI